MPASSYRAGGLYQQPEDIDVDCPWMYRSRTRKTTPAPLQYTRPQRAMAIDADSPAPRPALPVGNSCVGALGASAVALVAATMGAVYLATWALLRIYGVHRAALHAIPLAAIAFAGACVSSLALIGVAILLVCAWAACVPHSSPAPENPRTPAV